jgi:hypothetical protein
MSFWNAFEWSIDIHLFLQAQTPPQTKLLKGMQLVNRRSSLLKAQTIGQGKCKLHIQCRQNIITVTNFNTCPCLMHDGGYLKDIFL